MAKSHDTIGFLYYSGHGCQMDNVGYLIPTNVNSSKRLDVQYDAINIDKMLETLREAGNRVNMVFLDACRDNTPTGKKGGKKGLAQAPVMPKGTLVVYATEATKTADDNSNFINSLIAQIKQPNRSIRDIGYNISDDVAKQTGEEQIPQVFAQRVPNVVLNKANLTKSIVTINGLMYQNRPFTKKYTWEEAKDYCQGLTFGGYSDWRLPNSKELIKLLTKNKIQGQKDKYYIRKEFVKNLRDLAWFWTSTTYYEKDSSYAWSVYFYNGLVSRSFKSDNRYALCVR